MSEDFTCGQGIAEHAALPARLGSLLATVALNLELHLDSLDPTDEESRPEHAAYTALVEQHRKLAAGLDSLAQRMASCRALPMANHDPAVLGGPRVIAAFEALIDEQEQLLELLRRWTERDRALLPRAGGGADADPHPDAHAPSR